MDEPDLGLEPWGLEHREGRHDDTPNRSLPRIPDPSP